MISESDIIERNDIRERYHREKTVPGMKRNDVGTDIYKMVTIERRGREDGKL